MRFLLDTNVISEAIRPEPAHKVLNWLTQNSVSCAISVVSVGEIWQGIEMMPDGKRKDSYVAWFDTVESDFMDRILPIDLAVMKIWGTYCATLKARSFLPSSLDSLIAATALNYGMIVATRNTGDFPDVKTVNPFG